MTEAGNPQCDTEVLRKYADRMPECAQIITYRDIQKLEGQVKDWNERAHLTKTGHIHGSINVQGAQTGRCTHSGPNMAQVSSDHRARSLWVPLEAGHVIAVPTSPAWSFACSPTTWASTTKAPTPGISLVTSTLRTESCGTALP